MIYITLYKSKESAAEGKGTTQAQTGQLFTFLFCLTVKGNVKEYEIQQLGVTVVLYVSFDIIYLLLVRLYFHNLLLISSVILLQLTLLV